MRKVLIVGLALGALAAGAAEKVFTGAVDQYWSTPGNWQGGEAPVNGDSVVLASTTQTRSNNDIQGLTLANFTFSGYGENGGAKGAGSTQYQAYLQGNGFTLAAGGNLTLTSLVRLNQGINIALAEGAHEMSTPTVGSSRWDIAGNGTISGDGSLTLTGGLYIPYCNTTFKGDFTAKSGSEVYAFVNKPFGEGKVLFENAARLTMYKTSIDIANDIEFQGEANNTGNIIINNSGAFSGTVTFTNQQRFKAATSATPLILTFKGPVKSKSNSLLVTNLAVSDFRHELVFEDVADLGGRQLWMDGPGSTIRFKKAGNTFGSSRLSAGQIIFEVPGACCPTAELGMLGTVGSRIVVEGDQVAKRLFRHSGSDTGFSVTSQRGGRLILRDTQSDSFPGDITGPLGFVWAPTGNYTYTVNGVCSFSGALVVSNGTFAVGSALSSPTNIESIVLANAAKLQVPSGARVNTRLDTLSITTDSTLSLPEQTDFIVDHFLVDGVEQAEDTTYTGGTATEGQVHLDKLPANVTVYTRIQPGPGTRTEWTGQGGTSDRADLAVNWEGGTVPALHAKTLVAVTGGASASLVEDTAVNGISFEKGPFAVKGTSALGLYWGGISILNPAAEREAYTFSAPLRICGDQTWFVQSLATAKSGCLQMNAPITDGDDRPHAIYKTGAGYLYLNATNTFTGDLVISNGQVVVQTSESVGSPDAGKVVLSRADSATPNLWLCPNTKISRPVELYGPDNNYYYVRSDNSGVCELAGAVTIADTNNKRFQANGTSTMLFSGGIVGKGMFYVQGTGRYVITNKPLNTAGLLYSDVKADITLAAPSNYFSSAYLSNTNTILRIRTDDAIRDNRQIEVRKGTVIDLDGHVLSIGNLSGAGAVDVCDCVVTGGAGSELRINGTANLGVNAVFLDGASLLYKGAGYNMTLHGISSSTGTVSCANNCLIFAPDAGWTNGVVAVTNGNTAILVNSGVQFGRNTDVLLGNGGRLSLANGAEITCRHLYFDGSRQPTGTYGAAAASSANTRTDVYFWTGNKGVLRVLGDQRGTMLILR